MAIEDYYDFDYDDDRPAEVECKRCGKAGLYWCQLDGRWKLINKHGAVHVCSEKRLAKTVASKFDYEKN